ncbi:dipeptidyl carboxypeptidase II [Idiomarina tyrosinivorans]|uniref:Dipeptidyl carboxypeptidase II n=1 Tax=Idiomarina tyrosinivorans TaxID=1445662 RepID=A0A432ZLN8_9GAMM|nr:M3 family metallopeptidase [Idiomarina tyrosinivorans]RUO78901.1 dipeptidyl carboxypeptidase II [Idiomarina tyrosinivorans]
MKMTLVAAGIAAALSVAACGDNTTTSDKQSGANAEMSQQAATANPFFKPATLQYGAPNFDRIKFEHFEPAFREGLKQHNEEIAAIANNSEAPTFENTIVAMEKSGQLLSRVSAVFDNFASADSTQEIRDLEEKLAPEFAKHSDNIHLNRKLFSRIETLYKQKDALGLDPVSIRLIEETYKEFVQAGAKLSDEQQQKIRDINEKLSSLTTDFQSALLAMKDQSVVFVDDVDQLKGLSDSEIKSLANQAKERGKEGQYAIVMSNTTRHPILSQLENRALRKRVWEASANRGYGGTEADTRPIIKKMVQLRAEKAQLLGYDNWADYVLESRMAQDPKAAKKMLEDIVPAVVKNTKAEQADIKAMMNADGIEGDVQPWDWLYYAEKVRQQKYAIDADKVKPYFEFERVLKDGVFFTMHELYGITFEERKDLPVYEPDVRVFEVKDVDGSSIGLFYADYFTRDTKRGGAWMSSFRIQNGLLNQKPVIINNLNIVKAPEGQPTLLSFDEVQTMFHEMGHAVHGLFSDVKYPSLAGTNVPRDFVEFPSTFEEDWALNPRVIARYAKHYKTGEQIPQALLDKLLAAKNFNQGFDTLEYMEAALLDLSFHTVAPGTVIDDVGAFEEKALKDSGAYMKAVPPRYRSTYFQHVFAGGYSAGYYAYLWSEVFAADAFKYMREHGGLKLENGQAFRDNILSKGNSKDPMQQYIDWRGQEPSIDALLERRGLETEANN